MKLRENCVFSLFVSCCVYLSRNKDIVDSEDYRYFIRKYYNSSIMVRLQLSLAFLFAFSIDAKCPSEPFGQMCTWP